MSKITVGRLVIECVQGDITLQADMDAIVNAANAELMPGGGVAGAIHRAAGPGLAAECAPLAPIQTGQAVLTSGHLLPNPHVIHCLGPVYGRDRPADALLASCYRRALKLAEAHRLTSIAFPAISTGAFGFPMEPATRVALGTTIAEARHLEHLSRVRFVGYTSDALLTYETVLAALIHQRFPSP